MAKHYCQVRATLCSVINVKSELCSNLDCYELKGDEQELNDDEDALKVDGEGLRGDENALNVDGEALMGNGEALKGD